MTRKQLDSGFTEKYYDANGQAADRPALVLYERLAKRYFPRGTVLDFGCGTGPMLRRLSRYFEVIGVESSKWARGQAHNLTGKPIYLDMTDISEDSLTGIISLHVIEHIDDKNLKEVLSQWKRLLRKDGRLIIATPDATGYAAVRKKKSWIALTDPTHINLKGSCEWRGFFENEGFDVIKEGADGLWDFPYNYRLLGKAEVFLKGWPTLIQFLCGRMLLPTGSGESCLFVLKPR